MHTSWFTRLCMIFLATSLSCGCTLLGVFYQNKVDPVIYPSERDPGSLSIAAGLPLELDVGYYPSRNILTNAYVHTAALYGGGWGATPTDDNQKTSAGMSGHWVKRFGRINLSVGLGGDYGRTVGKNEANKQGSMAGGTYLSEHDLEFRQVYLQGAFGWQFDSGFGFGFLYKQGRSQLDFKSGLRQSPEARAPITATDSTQDSSGLLITATDSAQDISGLKKGVSFYELAHVIRFEKGPFEFQLQLKSGSSDQVYFRTDSGITAVVIYTIPTRSKNLQPNTARATKVEKKKEKPKK